MIISFSDSAGSKSISLETVLPILWIKKESLYTGMANNLFTTNALQPLPLMQKVRELWTGPGVNRDNLH